MASRKALRQELETDLAKLRADFSQGQKNQAYTARGEREVRYAIANVERLLKSNKLKGASNWLRVAREEMIKAYDLGAARLGARRFNPRQLRAGTAIEMEHTSDRRIAREIAMDHLAEDPRYYTKLCRVWPDESGCRLLRRKRRR